MPVKEIQSDPSALTMTVRSEHDAPVARLWQVWADPRQLERWWGPPTYPATVLEHDLSPGGRVTYKMTGPEGEEHHGWWRVIAVDAPTALEVEDGFGDADGTPNPDMPTTVFRVRLEDHPAGGTLMTITTTFPSLEAMEQMAAMGMEEGIRAAAGQIDDVLADQSA